MPETTLSLDAQKFLESIGKKKRKIIQKDYSNRKARNEAIFALGKQGIKGILLAEITGLSTQSISRIKETGSNNPRVFNRKEMELSRLKSELEDLFKRYQSFILKKPERKEVKRKLGRANKR